MTLRGRAPARRLYGTDATQETLNYALGNLGGRQKAWMTSPDQNRHAPPVKPAKARKSQPTADPLPSARASPTVATFQERQPASNSTSPQLANVLSRPQKGSTGPPAATVLPSPSPSEEAVVEHAPTPTSANLALSSASAGVQGIANARSEHEFVGGTSPRVEILQQFRQAAVPSKRPAEAYPTPANKRSLLGVTAQHVPAPIQTQIPLTAESQRRASGQQQYVSPYAVQTRAFSPHTNQQMNDGAFTEHAQAPINQRRTSSGQARYASASVVQAQGPPFYRHLPPPRQQNRIQRQPPVGVIPQSQEPSESHATLSCEIAQQPFGVPGVNTVPSPIVQSPIPQSPIPSGWYTREDCLRALDWFSPRSTASEQYPQDAKRLAVLREAIDRQDWVYLMLHQHYCLLSLRPDDLPDVIVKHANREAAVALLQRVLDKNESLSPTLQNFFANFPMPLPMIKANWPGTYVHQVSQICQFMLHAANYDSLKARCEQRGYPPLMRELACDLSIASPVLQRIVFRATLRSLWSPRLVGNPELQFQLETRAVAIFESNQADFYAREISRPSNQLQTFDGEQRERTRETQEWGGQLKALFSSYERLLTGMAQPTLPGQAESVEVHQVQQGRAAPTQRPAEAPRQAQRPMQLSVQQPIQQRTQHQVQQPVTRQPVPISTQATALPSPTALNLPPHSAQAAIQRGRGQPRLQPQIYSPPLRAPQPQTAPPQPIYQQASRSQRTIREPFLPKPGEFLSQQRQPNPARYGLHLAHLRSPELRTKPGEAPLYQYVKGFLKAPARLTKAGQQIEKWIFSLTADDLRSICKDVIKGAGAPALRTVDESTHSLRIRCVQWAAAELPDEHAWAIKDTSWIPYSYFKLNGTILHQRKRIYNGKDLPIDITTLVKEGENMLEIAVVRQPNDNACLNYLVAIERVGSMTHRSISEICLGPNRLDATVTLDRIRQKLNSTGDDDEIAIVESSVTIDLVDPFSGSNTCKIPVRGKACLHYQCFDLETYLHTRKVKGGATVPDQWRCPICNADARPHQLIHDSFLVAVREKLKQQGLLDTRAIVVDQDGSWRPKVEVHAPGGAWDRRDPGQEPALAPTRTSAPAQVEIIDLSD